MHKVAVPDPAACCFLKPELPPKFLPVSCSGRKQGSLHSDRSPTRRSVGTSGCAGAMVASVRNEPCPWAQAVQCSEVARWFLAQPFAG